MGEWPFSGALPDGIVLPFGVALCLTELAKVSETFEMAENISETEEAFGNYEPGRYAWRLDCIRPLREPVPIVGRQGLFNVPDDIADRIMEQLA